LGLGVEGEIEGGAGEIAEEINSSTWAGVREVERNGKQSYL
jgi:hypothetical protein